MNATNNGTSYNIIDSSSQLTQLVHKLENEAAIAVDVEADSMYHFKACIISRKKFA